MKPTRTLLAVLLVTGAAPAMAQSYGKPPAPAPQAPAAAAPEAKIKPSGAALKPLIALQKAYAAKDPAAIATALTAAKAAAQTKEDRYIIGQMQLSAALAASDSAATNAAIEMIAGSGYLPADRVAELFKAQGNGFSEKKQYAEAAAAFERGLAIDPNNAGLLGNLAEVRYAQGRPADAIPHLQKMIALSSAGGTKAGENIYKRAVAIAVQAKLPAAVDLSRAWLAAYPSQDSWSNAVAIYQNINRPDVPAMLDLLRLMRATGALTTAAHYTLFATAASDQGNFGEAQAVIDEGLSKQVIKPSDTVVKDVIAGLKSKPKPTAADLAVATGDAKTGTAMVRVGDRYYGLGDYAKASELYRKAEGKSDVDQNLVNLHLGMALARSGDKAGAAAALKKVTGPKAAVAQYWAIYVNQAA